MQSSTYSGFKPNLPGTAAYVAIHLGCVGIFFTGKVLLGLAILLFTFFFRMFFLSAVYHRYFAHRAYQTSRTVQFLMALFGTLTMQRGPLWWAATHRTHHQHADEPDDLHSPRYHGFFYAHSGWFLNETNRRTDLSKVGDFADYPELHALDNWKGYLAPVMAYGLILYLWFGWVGFFWGFCLSTVCLLHITHWIQSFSHSVGGYRRFVTHDDSRNHWLIGLISLGEFHNNHHTCPRAARQGCVWWEIDISYFVLQLIAKTGLIWNLQPFRTAAKEA